MKHTKYLVLPTLILLALALNILPANAGETALPGAPQIQTQAQPIILAAAATDRIEGKMSMPRLYPYSGCASFRKGVQGLQVKVKGVNLNLTGKYQFWTTDKATGNNISHVQKGSTPQEINFITLDAKPGMTISAEIRPLDITQFNKVISHTDVPVCANRVPTRR